MRKQVVLDTAMLPQASRPSLVPTQPRTRLAGVLPDQSGCVASDEEYQLEAERLERMRARRAAGDGGSG